MQIYMASIEGVKKWLLRTPDDYIEYGLVSYYYLRDDEEKLKLILSKVKHLLIDSGAHSFQHGKKVDFDDFTQKYANFIKRNTNNPKIEGFFEMDIDIITGYEKVKELRKVLTAVSDKIIPVWHYFRGIDDYYKMCEEWSGRRISIGGFKGFDITDGQYNLFLNVAHKYNCKVHILGMTRMPLIKTLNLRKDDSVDSSRWLKAGVFGTIDIPSKKKGKIELNSFQGLRSIKNSTYSKINYVTGIMIAKSMVDFENDIK